MQLKPSAGEGCRPCAVLRQNVDTAETRAVGQACLMQDIACVRVPIDRLCDHADILRAGALPVGSVEFVREAMRLARIAEPPSLSYPPELDHLLGRRIDLMPLHRVRGTRFVKPAKTKLFTGFVWHELALDSAYSEHDQEQLQALRSLPPDTMVWVSEPVRFLSEWRFYVLDGDIVSASRYDSDGADEAPSPNAEVVAEGIRALRASPGAPVSWALDAGVLDDGSTVVVEINDAWAIGLYGNAMSPRDYLRFLVGRWKQIADAALRDAPLRLSRLAR